MQTHVYNKAMSEKNQRHNFWQSEGVRYVRAMRLFLIPDIPNKC